MSSGDCRVGDQMGGFSRKTSLVDKRRGRGFSFQKKKGMVLERNSKSFKLASSPKGEGGD